MLRKAAAALRPALLRPFGAPAAVFFHGVERRIADPLLQINHHEIERFADIAEALKRDFDVMPLSELPSALAKPGRHRRTVFLMSDDGYANTATVAADVLQALNLPWTLFISTWHVDTGELNRMTLARDFLYHAADGDYTLPSLGLCKLNGARHHVAESILFRLRTLPAEAAEDAVAAMSVALQSDGRTQTAAAHDSERFLNWDQVRWLSTQGVTIGAHGHWHWPMHAKQQPRHLQQQAELPRRRIEQEVGPCRYFAYPFGNIGDIGAAAWRAVRDAGYDHAFTTLAGTLGAGQNPWLLPRYGLALREPDLPSLLPLIRLGNGRVARWQRRLS